MRESLEHVTRFDLSSLKYLGSTGEPWDPDSYTWFFEHVGGGRIPIINISGGTEIVGCFLLPLPITALKPTTLRGPSPGMAIDCVDDDGEPVREQLGYLVCRRPAPSMTKGFLNDPERYLVTYFSRFGEDVWFHGDWAYVDADGFWFLRGRADDTIKVSGRRTGPAEIEAALLEHPAVSEAAAVGVPHEIKGEGVVCFVVPQRDVEESEELRHALEQQVVDVMGKTMRPEQVRFVERPAQDALGQDRARRHPSRASRRGPRRPVERRGPLDAERDQGLALSAGGAGPATAGPAPPPRPGARAPEPRDPGRAPGRGPRAATPGRQPTRAMIGFDTSDDRPIGM